MALGIYKWWFGAILIFMGISSQAVEAPAPHPFFISITEMNHNQSEQVLEISVKLFYDDLEKVLSAEHKVMVDLNKPKDKAQVQKFIAQYLQQHLRIKLDGKAVTPEFLGYEIEREAAWCYLQVEQVSSIKKVDVFNDIFFQHFSSQINMMHVIVKGNRKSMRLNNPDTQASFEF
jgi:hypothetical protein